MQTTECPSEMDCEASSSCTDSTAKGKGIMTSLSAGIPTFATRHKAARVAFKSLSDVVRTKPGVPSDEPPAWAQSLIQRVDELTSILCSKSDEEEEEDDDVQEVSQLGKSVSIGSDECSQSGLNLSKSIGILPPPLAPLSDCKQQFGSIQAGPGARTTWLPPRLFSHLRFPRPQQPQPVAVPSILTSSVPLPIISSRTVSVNASSSTSTL